MPLLARLIPLFLIAATATVAAPLARAQSAAPAEAAPATPVDPAERRQPVIEALTEPEAEIANETLTGNLFGFGDRLSDQGIEVILGLTQVYQLNLHGGLATHRHAGRYAGSYDLEIGLDLQKLVGLEGGSIYLLAEGGWSEGLNASSVGALAGVNADAIGDRSIDLTEFWYQQSLADDRLRLRVGKIDLTSTFELDGLPLAFDGNRYANDEVGQFLNSALVNNLSIPFPDRGLGAMVLVRPCERLYLAFGGADAQADARETGFNTTFHGADHFFGIAEAGLLTALPSSGGDLPGVWRLGVWYDPRPKPHFVTGRTKRDDLGLYVSVDQMFLRESADDEQGLGGFLRYGLADSDVNDIHIFWSLGLEYLGLVPGRDMDRLGIGMAQSRLSGAAGYSAGHETIAELYYNARVWPWMYVSPHLQYVENPGGNAAVRSATVLGLRVQITF